MWTVNFQMIKLAPAESPSSEMVKYKLRLKLLYFLLGLQPRLRKKKGNAKECWNYRIIALILHASKVVLKILQARLQQYVNCELADVQAGFRKGRGTRDQIANIRWIIEKSREFQKNTYFCFTDYAKSFDCVDHHKLWKVL